MKLRESLSLSSTGVAASVVETDYAEWHVQGALIRNLIDAARGT